MWWYRTTAPCASIASCPRRQLMEERPMASRCRHRDLAWAWLAIGAALPVAHADDLPVCPPAVSIANAPMPGSSNVRLVTGAPYSALGTSQTTVILPDGSRVV